MRTGRTVGGARLRGFTASDLNLRQQALAFWTGNLLSHADNGLTQVGSIELVAEFAATFFEGVSQEQVCFFIDPSDATQTRNPLEGPYPHGRNGQLSSPLTGFFYLKYNKRGKPSTRLIKPGKYTPWLTDERGDIVSPYQFTPCRLSRSARTGKYKHIASYNLEELIKLGWDGAKYVSTRSRHAADGLYVPFIPGYDSDTDDEYDPIDVAQGKEEGTIGLPLDEVGLYMTVPEFNDRPETLVQLNKNG